MGMEFAAEDGLALYQLLAEGGSDIVLKLDGAGCIRHASPGFVQQGFPVALEGGEPCRLSDLACPDHAANLAAAFALCLAGESGGACVEFPARSVANGEGAWFELRLRRLPGEGAIGLLRCTQERHVLDDRLFAASLTDPLTGLTNRPAFVSMLQHLVDRRLDGFLAIFAIDDFKAMNMRFGQAFGDEVLVTFAQLLRTLVRSDDIVSRISGQSLGVLLPAAQADQAEAVCRRVMAALEDIREAAGHATVPITASVGLARLGGTLDGTLKRAELALFLAKAKGRGRLELDGERLPWEGAPSLAGSGAPDLPPDLLDRKGE